MSWGVFPLWSRLCSTLYWSLLHLTLSGVVFTRPSTGVITWPSGVFFTWPSLESPLLDPLLESSSLDPLLESSSLDPPWSLVYLTLNWSLLVLSQSLVSSRLVCLSWAEWLCNWQLVSHRSILASSPSVTLDQILVEVDNYGVDIMGHIPWREDGSVSFYRQTYLTVILLQVRYGVWPCWRALQLRHPSQPNLTNW
jgi:hypothetical protein